MRKYKNYFIYLVLVIITLAVYWQVTNFEFTNYDDDKYVSENIHIATGLKWDNIVWVFTNEHVCNWHPITGLSHILDCQFFALNSGRHHLINLLFHIANTSLLFIIFKKITGGIWQSAFVAAIFSIHPLHVESVAWIAERKDVLSTLFGLLTIAAYIAYTKKTNSSKYILTIVLFTLGLMAKPMLVTLPFVLLLLDYWPLERLKTSKDTFRHLIFEKIPFFIISTVFSVITVFVQSKTDALASVTAFSFPVRISNALSSYIKYLEKIFWPADLAVFYPHPANLNTYLPVLISALFLIAITILILRLYGRYKYLITGWFWFLGTLVPVIGLVQVGAQSHADRYTYIPSIGIFIILAWGINDLFKNWKHKALLLWPLSIAIILILSALTHSQTSYWRNSVTLFDHAIKVTKQNDIAYYNRAKAHYGKKQYDLALSDYTKSIEICPRPQAFINRGKIYNDIGQYDFAIQNYSKAIELNPSIAEAYNNRGAVYFAQANYSSAICDYTKAIELNPQIFWAYFNKANACENAGLKKQALESYKKFLTIVPPQFSSYIELSKQKIILLEK